MVFVLAVFAHTRRMLWANSDSGQRTLLTSKGHVLADRLGGLVKGNDFWSTLL